MYNQIPDNISARFAPADNLYDAIRSDLASTTGFDDFEPLQRYYVKAAPDGYGFEHSGVPLIDPWKS
jgi:hypothetical protein